MRRSVVPTSLTTTNTTHPTVYTGICWLIPGQTLGMRLSTTEQLDETQEVLYSTEDGNA